MEQSPANLLLHFAAEAPYAVPGRYRTRRAVRLSSSAEDEKINIVRTTDQKTEVEEGQAAQKTDVKEAVAETATHTFRCPICLSPYVEPTALKVCGHVFCGPCVAQALEKRRKKECPTCRTKASKRHLFRIYLS